MTTSPTLAELRSGFALPPRESRPMMRWWWFGPDVCNEELEAELHAVADAGFGGVEVSYVYPLSEVAHPLLSSHFLAQLRFASDCAKQLGLRFDVTLGTGWSFGGPHIAPEHAARKLFWDRREVPGEALELPVVSPWPGDELVAAFVGDGSLQEMPTDFTELAIDDGVVRVDAGRSPRVVLLAYSRLTGQNVKRAAVGGEGPVLDHYSAQATRAHIAGFAEPLISALDAGDLGSVFCDSLEVYDANWTPSLASSFEERRGYDPRPRLFQLVVDGADARAFRADFHRTLTELYEQNFVAVLQSWAAAHGVPFRIQGYGTPPASVSSYRFADLYEGEGWGWNEVTQTRWASSAAHLYGVDVVSSEVWTWVHSPSFRATPLDLKGEAHEHLLAGINQFIGHGWPYSPPDAPGLGWMFYASGAINARNPWWPAMPELTAYLQRLCWLLRQGAHVAKVKLYVPTTDVYSTMGTDGVSLDLWRESRRHIGSDIPRILHERGLDFDLVDDDALETLDPVAVEVVVLPSVGAMPAASQRWLERVRDSGGVVIDVRVEDDDSRGAVCVADFAKALTDTVPPDYAISPISAGIGVVHRRTDQADIYFVANTTSTRRAFRFLPRVDRAGFEVWDPATGRVTSSGALTSRIPIRLDPYQATVVVALDEPGDAVRRPVRYVDRHASRLNGPWTAEFLGEPAAGPIPVSLPHRWEEQRTGYSGSVAYETTFTADAADLASAERLLLDFGGTMPDDAGSASRRGVRGASYRVQLWSPVREVAVVVLNGVTCGILWAPPYRLDLRAAAVDGSNRLRIVVYNTGANALEHDEAIARVTDASIARYGRRFRMQDFDHTMDGVSSGLLAVPRLRWQRVARSE